MKKLLILCVFLFIFSFCIHVDAKENYKMFEDIEIQNGKMLADYTDSDYEEYYKKVTKRKFFGWRINIVNKKTRAKFISETVFSYYNNGTRPITYKYELSESTVEKVSISATGSIGTKVSGEIKMFKFGLDSETKINADYSSTTTKEEATKLEIIIDPKTVANLRMVGEGQVTNGVAAYYIFWITVQKGGFEYFVVTTLYPRLEVLPI